MEPIPHKSCPGNVREQPIISIFTLTNDLLKRISNYMSPFQYLTLSEVSKEFYAKLKDNSFWSEKFIKMIQPITGYGISMRSQLILRAIDEYQLMKESREYCRDESAKKWLDSNLKEAGQRKLRLINTPEMARQAGRLCPLFLKYVDKKLMADRLFVLELTGIEDVLKFTSRRIKKDFKMQYFALLNVDRPLRLKNNDNNKNFLYIHGKLKPEQRALLIQELTESIKADILAKKYG